LGNGDGEEVPPLGDENEDHPEGMGADHRDQRQGDIVRRNGMIITIESTEKIVTLNGVTARIWEGKTQKGIPIHCYITRIAVSKEEDSAEFDKDLQEHRAPSEEVQGIPLRMIL
jgi:hypothetical protein